MIIIIISKSFILVATASLKAFNRPLQLIYLYYINKNSWNNMFIKFGPQLGASSASTFFTKIGTYRFSSKHGRKHGGIQRIIRKFLKA